MKRVILAFAIVLTLTACGGAGGRGASAARPVWINSLQMISPVAGWALVSTANPNSSSALDVARTSDEGRTWNLITPSSARAALSTGQALLYVTSAQRAWVVGVIGRSSVVFGTADGGRSWWLSRPIAADQPVGISFASADQGWLLESMGAAMGQNPVRLYRSSDGGRSWVLAASSAAMPGDILAGSGLPVACDKTGIAASPPGPGSGAGMGWISGFCPKSLNDAVLVSRDAGAHWSSPPLPLPESLCEQTGCEIADPQFAGRTTFVIIWAYPDQALLLSATDGGADWRTVIMPVGAGPYPRVRFFGPVRGIAVSAGSQDSIGRTFYVTSDGGRKWTPVAQGRRFRNGASFDFLSPGIGFAWWPNEAPVMYQTFSSGRSWTSFAPHLG